jgi:hypothetical protein
MMSVCKARLGLVREPRSLALVGESKRHGMLDYRVDCLRLLGQQDLPSRLVNAVAGDANLLRV